jgi:ATP-dependent Clp protease ATP-binding subunit ClpB
VEYFAEKSFDPVFGARPLRRLIEKELEDKLSEMIIDKGLKNVSINVTIDNSVIVLNTEGE